MMQQLLQAGADPHVQDDQGLSAFDHAILGEHDHILPLSWINMISLSFFLVVAMTIYSEALDVCVLFVARSALQ